MAPVGPAGLPPRSVLNGDDGRLTAKMHTKHRPAQRSRAPRMRIFPFVWALIALTNCSKVISDTYEVPKSGPVIDYRTLIANTFRITFTDYQSYSSIEISAPRLVDSAIGRTSLTCLRFEVKGRRRVYVYLIKNDAIVAARYDVQTDDCAAQSYAPFNLITGAERPAGAPPQNPIY